MSAATISKTGSSGLRQPPRPAGLPNWLTSLPFVLLHLAPLAILITGTDVRALLLCGACYLLQMVGITVGYHRYFSHRAYRTSRVFQFVLACLGCSALQKGPLWWAAQHRHHHRTSDTPEDLHSPVSHSFWWSHVGWVLSPESAATDEQAVRDLGRYPELRWLDRYHWVPPVLLAGLCPLLGGWSGLVWGFFVSNVLSRHATFTVNSLCHLFGRRRYATADDSRNNLFVALITLGEGWHNNHHHYQSSANQGFFWWEVDVSYYLIRLLGWVGLVWGIRRPPPAKLPGSVGKAHTAATPARLLGRDGLTRGRRERGHQAVARSRWQTAPRAVLRRLPMRVLLILVAGFLLGADAPRDAEPPLVGWARTMVQGVRRDDTSYRHKETSVTWKGLDGATGYECHTDCSGFLNALLRRAYGVSDETFEDWFGTRRPFARTYHDAIEKQSHFQRLAHLKDVRPGDVLAIRYPADDPENKDRNTGHVLLVAAKPQPRRASAPLVEGTEQWEVAVIDESRSGHGTTDTRHQEGGGFVSGVGEGVFRIYTQKDGTVAGHSWSTQKHSEYHDQGGRHLVIGRLVVREKP